VSSISLQPVDFRHYSSLLPSVYILVLLYVHPSHELMLCVLCNATQFSKEIDFI